MLGSLLNHQLPFLEHAHEFDPDECVVSCVERFEPRHGSNDTFDGPMILLDDLVQVFHLPNDDGNRSPRWSSYAAGYKSCSRAAEVGSREGAGWLRSAASHASST